MPLEIEIKLKVDSFEPTIEKLKSHKAEFQGDFLQADSYYDDDADSLINSDRCLRIRTHNGNGQQVIELTYKGQRQNHRFKTRREIDIKVEKAAELADIFENLGYKKKLAFQKKRSLWRLDGCEVALDQLPLIGKFVEIEGPDDETIESVQKKLCLEHLNHIPSSYAHQIEDELKKRNSTAKEVTFNSEPKK